MKSFSLLSKDVVFSKPVTDFVTALASTLPHNADPTMNTDNGSSIDIFWHGFSVRLFDDSTGWFCSSTANDAFSATEHEKAVHDINKAYRIQFHLD